MQERNRKGTLFGWYDNRLIFAMPAGIYLRPVPDILTERLTTLICRCFDFPLKHDERGEPASESQAFPPHAKFQPRFAGQGDACLAIRHERFHEEEMQ